MPRTMRQWILAKPLDNGVLRPDLFELHELPIPELKQVRHSCG